MNKKLIIGTIVALAMLTVAWMLFVQPSDPTVTAAHEHADQQAVYTCPMHPSVISDRPGACPVCNMALVKKSAPKELDMKDMESLQTVSLSPTQRVIANVSTVHAVKRDMGRNIQAVGLVSYAEPNYRHISARFPGRLEKLYLSYTGQSVRKGDPVADVYSPEAVTAQQEYLLALDAYEQAQRGGQSYLLSAEQLLEQTKQKLLLWGFTERQVARVKETRSVEYVVKIYSPISGIVVKKSVDPQHYTSTGEDMFDVADLSSVWIYVDVYETDIRFVNVGQKVSITTEAYPNETFLGKVIFIDPVVNPETRSLRVRTEFANPQMKLKPNMYVTASIAVPRQHVLVVPSAAVISTGKRNIVWVEVDENAFEPRVVVTGATFEGNTAIHAGLKEHDVVVATGGYLIDSEAALQQPASANLHAGHGASSVKEKQPSNEDHTSHDNAVQQIKVLVKDGYSPAQVRVSAGKPVKLVFYRDEKSACSDELVIEKYGIRKKLAAFANTVVEFTPKEAGEFPFTCGMNMLHGKLLVEPR